MGHFGAELLKCSREQIRTKSAKVGDGRPGPLAGARRPLHKKVLAPRSGAKPLKRVPGGPPQKGPRSGGGPKAAKEGGYRPLRKNVMALPAGQSCQSGRLPGGQSKTANVPPAPYVYYPPVRAIDSRPNFIDGVPGNGSPIP